MTSAWTGRQMKKRTMPVPRWSRDKLGVDAQLFHQESLSFQCQRLFGFIIPSGNHRNGNVENYDIVFIGFPNWWYTLPMAVLSFVVSASACLVSSSRPGIIVMATCGILFKTSYYQISKSNPAIHSWTAGIAAWIQQEVGGDLFSIVVEDPYSSDYDECLWFPAGRWAAGQQAQGYLPALPPFPVSAPGLGCYLDYLAIMGTFIFLAHFAAKLLRKRKERKTL